MTTHINFTTEESHTGQRLDKILSSYCPTLSRSKVQKLIVAGNLSIDTQTVTDCSLQVKPDQFISFSFIEETNSAYVPIAKEMPLNIVYEDEHLLVINKNHGVTVHPGAGNKDDTLVNALVFYLGKNLSAMGGAERPGIVHRLDRDTSGLMVVAKNDITHAYLGNLLQERLIKREYVTLVYGVPYPLSGKIETYLARNEAQRTAMRVVRDSGKWALTNYELAEILANNTVSKVICRLETGRTHQIRVHMLHKKIPVIGDQLYGRSLNHNLSSLPKTVAEALRNFPRQALHAQALSFEHPISGEQMEFHAPLPTDMQTLYDTLKAVSHT